VRALPPSVRDVHQAKSGKFCCRQHLSRSIWLQHTIRSGTRVANLTAREMYSVSRKRASCVFAREAREECGGCSKTKSGPADPATGRTRPVHRRGHYARLRRSTGIDRFPKAPFVLSVTCRSVGYTELRVISNGSAKTVVSAFDNMLHTMGISRIVREVWTHIGKQFVSAAREALAKCGSWGEASLHPALRAICWRALRSTISQHSIRRFAPFWQLLSLSTGRSFAILL
jgi:hypothetical protein